MVFWINIQVIPQFWQTARSNVAYFCALQLSFLLFHWKLLADFIFRTVEIYKVLCSIWLCSGKKWALSSAAPGSNNQSIFYAHLRSSQRLNQSKAGEGQSWSRTPTWPLTVTELSVLCSQKPFVMVTDLFSVSACEKSLSFNWSAVKEAESSSHKWICCFVPPDSLQRRSTQPETPLWSSSAPTIQSTKKDFTSATPAPSSRTHCTHASDQRGPEGAVRGKGANGGAPRGGASLTLGNLRPPRWIRHDRTAARPPTAPQLLGALAPPTDCEE